MTGSSSRKTFWLAGILASLLLSASTISVAATDLNQGAASPPPRIWLDRDGQPLPFETEEQILDYLRTAEVISIEAVGTGITQPRRVDLEKDGIRMRAIFHTIDLRRERARIGDRFHMFFRDSWEAQVAAYRLAMLLEYDNVAPTVRRRIGAEEGSLQAWIENEGLMTDAERLQQGIRPVDAEAWLEQRWAMEVFDALIFNDDRNPTNVLLDAEGKLWMIDHTRAFQRSEALRDPGRVNKIERRLWSRVRTIADESFRDLLGDILEPPQIGALLTRRRALIEHFEKLIVERGEDEVLYSSGESGVQSDPRSGGGPRGLPLFVGLGTSTTTSAL